MDDCLTPEHLRDVWPDFDWDNAALHALDLPVERHDVAELAWILEHPVWSSRPPAPLFDLAPRAVLDDPALHPGHAARIEAADPEVPVLLTTHRGRPVVLDGLHRLARCLGEGRASIVACVVTRAQAEASRAR